MRSNKCLANKIDSGNGATAYIYILRSDVTGRKLHPAGIKYNKIEHNTKCTLAKTITSGVNKILCDRTDSSQLIQSGEEIWADKLQYKVFTVKYSNKICSTQKIPTHTIERKYPPPSHKKSRNNSWLVRPLTPPKTQLLPNVCNEKPRRHTDTPPPSSPSKGPKIGPRPKPIRPKPESRIKYVRGTSHTRRVPFHTKWSGKLAVKQAEHYLAPPLRAKLSAPIFSFFSSFSHLFLFHIFCFMLSILSSPLFFH